MTAEEKSLQIGGIKKISKKIVSIRETYQLGRIHCI